MERSEIRDRPHGLPSRSRITLRSIRATIATASLFQLGDLLAAVLGVERVKDVIKWPMSAKRLAARARQQHVHKIVAGCTVCLRSDHKEVALSGVEIDFALPAGVEDATVRLESVMAGRPAHDKIRAGRKLADFLAVD